MRIRAWLIGALASLLLCGQVSAQGVGLPFYPLISVPGQTVVGRAASTAGPVSAIPFTVLQSYFFTGETPVADANYSMVAADKTIVYTSLSAARTVTLLSAGSFAPGTRIFLLDRSGSASGSFTISVAPTGADLINGVNGSTIAIQSAYGGANLESDGISQWTLAGVALPANSVALSNLAQIGGGTILGNNTGATANVAATVAPVLGIAGTSVGSVAFANATSGTVKIQPVTGALGSVTLSLPAATDQIIARATTDTLTNKTYDIGGTGNVFKVNGNQVSAGTGTGNVVLATSPTLITPTLGVATATSIDGLTITTSTGTLTITNGKTLSASNTLTLAGTDSTTMTFPSTSTTVAGLGVTNAFTGANSYSGVTTWTGSLVVPMRVITAAGAITVSATTDYFICVNKASGAATTVNLPGSPATGLTFLIKDCKGDAATNNITITPAAGNIDGAGTNVMSTNHGSVAVTYDGTQWEVN